MGVFDGKLRFTDPAHADAGNGERARREVPALPKQGHDLLQNVLFSTEPRMKLGTRSIAPP